MAGTIVGNFLSQVTKNLAQDQAGFNTGAPSTTPLGTGNYGLTYQHNPYLFEQNPTSNYMTKAYKAGAASVQSGTDLQSGLLQIIVNFVLFALGLVLISAAASKKMNTLAVAFTPFKGVTAIAGKVAAQPAKAAKEATGN